MTNPSGRHVFCVFAKDRRAAPAKTRLARTVGRAAADVLADALLEDALNLARDVAREGPAVCLLHAPDAVETRGRFAALAPDLLHRAQHDGDLGRRMSRCVDAWFGRGAKRVVIVGTDCPTLDAGDVADAFTRLDSADFVLAPASDGGYVLMGLSRPCPELFEGIDWGGETVLAQTAAAARAADRTLALLPAHADLDRADDLRPLLGRLIAHAAAGAPRGDSTRRAIETLLNGPAMSPPRSEVTHFGDIPPVACPCGEARRAWAAASDFPATVHRTRIALDAKPHVHRGQTECYVVLSCGDDAALELDGRRVPVTPGSTALIRPGCVHRAVGEMEVLIVCAPKFDPADERVVESP